MADGTDGLISELYYEITLVTSGMDAGEAKAKASLKALESAADQLGVSMKRVSADVATQTAKMGANIADVAKGAEKPASDAGRRIGAAVADGVAKASPGRVAGEQLVAGLRTKLEASKADIVRAVEAGLMSPKQAESAGRAAGQSYVAGIREGLASLKAQGVPIADADLTGIYRNAATAITPVAKEATAAAGAIEKVGTASEGAARGGLGTVERAFASVTSRVLGVNGSIGRLVSTLGIMVEGAGITLAVTAAIGLIGSAYELLAGKANKAKQEVDKLIASMLHQREVEHPQETAARDIKTLKAQAEADRLALDAARAPRPVVGTGANAVLFASVAQAADVAAATKTATESTSAYNQAVFAGLDAQRTQASQLGDLIGKHQASNAQIAKAAELVSGYRDQLAGLSGTDEDTLRKKTLLVGLIDSLTSAQNKEAKSAESAAEKRKRLADEQINALNGFRDQVSGLKASLTTDATDNFTASLAKLDEEARRLQKSGALKPADFLKYQDDRKQIVDLQSAKLADETRRALAQATISQVDDLGLAIEDLSKKYEHATGPAKAFGEQLIALKTVQRDLAADSEALAGRLQAYEDAFGGGHANIQLLSRLDIEKTRAEKELSDAQRDVTAATTAPAREAATNREKAARAALLVIEQRIKTTIDEQTAANQRAAAQAVVVENQIEKISGKIANAANAAILLASAFGEVGRKVAGVLGGIAQVSGGIHDLTAAANKVNPTTGKVPGFSGLLSSASGIASLLPGAGQIVGGILQGVQAASSLFGESPAIKAAREETQRSMSQLRDALLSLRDSYIQDVSGANIKADEAFVERAAALGANGVLNGRRVLADGEGNGAGRRGNLRDIGAGLGLDFDNGELLKRFKELDSRYGTNLASFVEREAPTGLLKALQTLPDALKSAIGHLGSFDAKDPSAIMARVAFQFDLLGKTDPSEKIHATVKALESAGISFGEFQQQVDKLLDPNLSAADRATLIASVSDRLGTGTGLDFGGLTPEQFRSLFLDASKATGADATKGQGSFSVDRSITEVTGSRLAAMLSTGNVFLEQISANTAGILVGIGGAPSPVMYAPTLPAASAMTTSTSKIDININHTFNGGVAGLSAADVASIAESTEDALQRALRDPSNITIISRGIDADNAWAQRSTGEMR